MRYGLTATQLKFIAVIAMVCDHIAWAVFDFNTPQAQIMHVIGRLTLPIMCFFVVEGFRHTRSVAHYTARLFAFGVISIFPFYVFFHEMYGYRQNIIFDLLLGLLSLAVMEDKEPSKGRKFMIVLMFIVFSILMGGWPILPILYIFIFYNKESIYKKESFRKIAIRIFLVTVLMVIILSLFSIWNQRYAIFDMDWTWNDKLYLLGFVLALPLLRLYNGKLGSKRGFKYFFYCFYPLHFLIIQAVFLENILTFHQCLVYLHIITMVFVLLLAYQAIQAKPSKAQTANLMLLVFALVFMVGYYLEYTTKCIEVARAAAKVEYVGMGGILLSLTWFVDEFCNNKFSRWLYVCQSFIVMVSLGAIFTMEYNTLFYRDFSLIDLGEYAIVSVKPGILYYILYAYIICFYIMVEMNCYKKLKSSTGLEKKRSQLIFIGTLSPIIVTLIKCAGITKGYDIMTLGCIGFLFCYTIAVVKYDYLDSFQTSAETDALTGLGNRMFLVERVEAQLQARSAGALFMLDMDNFKLVNDNYGHGVGDKVLIIFSDILREVIGEEHYIARIGGDEFSIFLNQITKKSTLGTLASDIIQKFQDRLQEENITCDVSCSIGISICYGNKEEIYEVMYENADKALYLAKNSGKSQYRFYQQSYEETIDLGL